MDFYSKLLTTLNLSKEEYDNLIKDVTLDDIENPMNFSNIDKAVRRIQQAIANHEKIMVYGDYDCDGITSTSILVKTFKMLNYDAGYYIPSRYKDGYGINEKMVELIHQKGYNLIITVDNGVSQVEALNRAKNYGIDVILTDHHEMLKDLPECFTIVHPFIKEQDVLAECGAYVAFMLSILLLGRIDHYLLCLAALATISDMMPLVSHNRCLLKNALKILNEENFPQFKILLFDQEIDEKSLSFFLAPKINAVGRVKEDTSVNRLVKYFVSTDEKEQVRLANYINTTNDERKEMCIEAFNNLHIEEFQDSKVVIAYIPHLKEGLIGLVAARILNTLNKPAIVFTKSIGGMLKGSGRSLNGFSLAESFDKLKDIIEVYGGHSLAGGLTLKEENLELFKKKINELAENSIIVPKELKLIEMDQDDFTYENYQILRNLGPYGEGFEEPYLSYKLPNKNFTFIGKGKNHMKGYINSHCSFIAFNVDKNLLNKEDITLIGKLEQDTYRGRKNIVFKINEIK